MSSKYSAEILFVSGDAMMREYVEELLTDFGYTVNVADSFNDGKAWLLVESPALLIADIRLGDFNGLHLAWLRYFADPTRPSIVLHTRQDRSLEKEARKLNAPFVVLPVQEQRFMRLVDDGLHAARRQAQLPGIPLPVAQQRSSHLRRTSNLSES